MSYEIKNIKEAEETKSKIERIIDLLKEKAYSTEEIAKKLNIKKNYTMTVLNQLKMKVHHKNVNLLQKRMGEHTYYWIEYNHE